MKFIIVFILGLILIGGPLYVLYELGLKYKRKKKFSRKYKQTNIKKQDDAIIASTYKIRFNGSKDKK
jgi:hypothetical protein